MMESSLQNLNAPQREAATTIDQHVRIIAGAGSGKTRVLMARIAYLVNEVGILPWRIMAITFTNKAANEMKERLSKELGEDAQKVKISTIHALCVRILREDAHLIDYPKSFTIMDRDDQKTVIKKLYKIKHIKNDEIPANSLIAYISTINPRTFLSKWLSGLLKARNKNNTPNCMKPMKKSAKKCAPWTLTICSSKPTGFLKPCPKSPKNGRSASTIFMSMNSKTSIRSNIRSSNKSVPKMLVYV